MKRDIVVMGGSAGSLEPLREIVRDLDGFRGAVLVAVHAYAGAKNHLLPELLAHAGSMPATTAKDGDPIASGRILVAPPGRHLIVEPDHVRVTTGPRENGSRPAIDPLFRTAARVYGSRVMGVLLSGRLDDGTYGLAVIKAHGGTCIVQSPENARESEMPESAIRNVRVDSVLPSSEIGAHIRAWADEPIADEEGRGRTGVPDPKASLSRIARDNGIAGRRRATVLTCPDCHGVMMRLERPDLLHFECQVGHARSPMSLDDAQRAEVSSSLTSAVRALRERALFMYMSAERVRASDDIQGAADLEERARSFEGRAEELVELMTRIDAL